MNARIQTWFPFRIQICLNGREWLARQMDALASVDDTRRLEELTAHLERSTQCQGRPIRGLRVLGEDNPLLLAVNRGQFSLNAFRNRDLQWLLYGGQKLLPAQAKCRSATKSKKLRPG